MKGKIEHYTNCEVVVETRSREGLEPAVFIKEPNGKVIMVTVTPDHNLDVKDNTGYWDIKDGKGVWVGESK